MDGMAGDFQPSFHVKIWFIQLKQATYEWLLRVPGKGVNGIQGPVGDCLPGRGRSDLQGFLPTPQKR